MKRFVCFGQSSRFIFNKNLLLLLVVFSFFIFLVFPMFICNPDEAIMLYRLLYI